MSTSLGEAYSLLGQGFSSTARSRESEIRRLMRQQQRQQLITAAFTPLATGLGQAATDIISAPFRDAPKDFLNSEEGRRLRAIKSRQKNNERSISSYLDQVASSGLDEMSYIRNQVTENVDRQMAEELGGPKVYNEDTRIFYADERQRRIEENTKYRFDQSQKAQRAVAQYFTDEEFSDAIKRYNPEPSNVGEFLWRGVKTLVPGGKTRDEMRRDAFDSMLSSLNLSPEDYNDPEKAKESLARMREEAAKGIAPFSPEQLSKQLSEDYRDNNIFRANMQRLQKVREQFAYFSNNHPNLFNDLYRENDGDPVKTISSIVSKIAQNSELDDPSTVSNINAYVNTYNRSSRPQSSDLKDRLAASFYNQILPKREITNISDLKDSEIAKYSEEVSKQLKATYTTAYTYATIAAARQLEELKVNNEESYNAIFGSPAKADEAKQQLIFSNMDNLLNNHMEMRDKEIPKFLSADKTMSIHSGRIEFNSDLGDFDVLEIVTPASATGGESADSATTGTKVPPPITEAVTEAVTQPVKDDTDVDMERMSGAAIKAQYDSGETAEAFRAMRRFVKQEIENKNISNSAQAVAFGIKTSQDIADRYGLPNPLTTGTGRPAVKSSVFAQDGDTQEFSIGGGSKTLLADSSDVKYTLSLDDGQVNIDVSQESGSGNKARIYSRNPLALEDIPESNIKNHLTYLKMTYQDNIEDLKSMGIDDPSSRSLSGLGGKARELKMINNEILGAIDLPGLGDRGDVISFLTATPIEKPQQADSLLSDPTEEAPAVADFEAPDVDTVEQVAAEVSKLFNDGSAATALLRETAIQESNMGQTPGTYKMVDDKKFGRGSFGVGQVDERNFEDTMSRLRGDKGQPRNLVKYVQRFKDAIGIDLTEVEYEDLADPRLGLIFTRLHYLKNPDPVPPTVQGRSKYWKKFYNTSAGAGTPDEYLSNQEAYDKIYGDD